MLSNNEGERNKIMEISKNREGNQLTVTLTGELNTATAPELEAAIKDDIQVGDTVVFDMTGLTYMTSAGLRILVASEQATGGSGAVTLRGVCKEIRQVIEVTGFDSIFNIE